MSIKFACEQCGKTFTVKDELAGRKAKCKCGHVFTVPQASTADEEDIFDIKEEVAPPRPAPRPVAVAKPVVASAPAIRRPQAVTAAAAKAQVSRAEPVAASTSVRRFAYLVLLAALIPLAWSIFVSTNFDPKEALRQTVKHHPEVAAKLEQVLSSDTATEQELFDALPDHKFEGAWLSHNTYQHWFYALLSSAAFTALILAIFPKSTESIGRMIAVGLFTATVGIFLLLGFQYVAEWTQGFWIRGRGIIVLLFYIVKFIGFSYRAALDPDTNFVLSAIGFTFGVGLCEELCKASPILLHYHTKAQWPWRTACMVGLISGVGFGVSEGITYSADFYNGVTGGHIYLVRFISCVALHAVWTGATAIFIFRQQAQLTSQDSFWGVLLVWVMLVSVSMVLHGLYDTLLKKHMDAWALLTALLSFAWLIWQIEAARRDFDPQEQSRPIPRAALA